MGKFEMAIEDFVGAFKLTIFSRKDFVSGDMEYRLEEVATRRNVLTRFYVSDDLDDVYSTFKEWLGEAVAFENSRFNKEAI